MGLPCRRAVGWSSAVIFPIPASLCQETSAALGQHLSLSCCPEAGGGEVFGTVVPEPKLVIQGWGGWGGEHFTGGSTCVWGSLSVYRWPFPLSAGKKWAHLDIWYSSGPPLWRLWMILGWSALVICKLSSIRGKNSYVFFPVNRIAFSLEEKFSLTSRAANASAR